MGEYYSSDIKKSKSNIISMAKFHNYLKRTLYDKYIGGKYKKCDFILELAGGRGADLFKLIANKVKYVTFIDYDKNALIEAKKRYKNISKKTKVPKIDFFQGDLRQDLTINNIIKKNYYQSVNIHFAIHYMMENKKTISNFFKNVNHGLRKNGIFIFTSFDGNKVLKLFEKYNIKKNEILALKNNEKEIFKIKKLFTENELKKYGQKIDVFIETIGNNTEYLTNFEYLIDLFIRKKYIVLEDNNFSFIRKKYFDKTKLTKSEIEYSDLNRYIVLQKLI
tara:strand:- start:775 stop:1608 length:834 start_codon:yes stop_codon:yes gene_type:complete